MAIPNYEQAMIPVLHALDHAGVVQRRDITQAVADAFGLTEAERQQLLPSGAALTIASRVGWALSYMKQAGLVSSPKRSHYEITDRGRKVLLENPEGIDSDFLQRFAEFKDFQARTRVVDVAAANGGIPASAVPSSGESPEEGLESAYVRLRANVQQELLEAARNATPAFFEQLVVDLLVRMGYGGSRPEAARAVGRTGDGGIDGVIDEDRLGLEVIYVQAKRWENTVGRPDVQKFAGALQGQRARKGIFITTSTFSHEAVEYVQRIDSRIVLIDGRRLAELMFDFDVGAVTRIAYQVKRIDVDYFEE